MILPFVIEIMILPVVIEIMIRPVVIEIMIIPVLIEIVILPVCEPSTAVTFLQINLLSLNNRILNNQLGCKTPFGFSFCIPI